MQLTPFCLMLSACLQVTPDKSQFFRYDSVSLRCSARLNATSWQVRRRTPRGGANSCSDSWGSESSNLSCVIGNLYPSDSGEYWCESADGRRSNSIDVFVTDRTVILEVPTHPVSRGAAVTLRCKAEIPSPSHVFDFFKDGRHVWSSSTGEMSIGGASKSDEGVYKCGVSTGGESASSRLLVEASAGPAADPAGAGPADPAEAGPADLAGPVYSISRILVHLVVGVPYLTSTVLLALVCRDRNRDPRTGAKGMSGQGVVMETMV